MPNLVSLFCSLFAKSTRFLILRSVLFSRVFFQLIPFLWNDLVIKNANSRSIQIRWIKNNQFAEPRKSIHGIRRINLIGNFHRLCENHHQEWIINYAFTFDCIKMIYLIISTENLINFSPETLNVRSTVRQRVPDGNKKLYNFNYFWPWQNLIFFCCNISPMGVHWHIRIFLDISGWWRNHGCSSINSLLATKNPHNGKETLLF